MKRKIITILPSFIKIRKERRKEIKVLRLKRVRIKKDNVVMVRWVNERILNWI